MIKIIQYVAGTNKKSCHEIFPFDVFRLSIWRVRKQQHIKQCPNENQKARFYLFANDIETKMRELFFTFFSFHFFRFLESMLCFVAREEMQLIIHKVRMSTTCLSSFLLIVSPLSENVFCRFSSFSKVNLSKWKLCIN